jgi:ABC-type transport system involved in cytochrome c biogenesis permease subunit
MAAFAQRFRQVGLFCARTEIFSFALFWLMCLTVGGTLAQRSIGLYRAQELYFSSFVYWVGFIPTPGGYTTMGVVFIGLLAKLIFDSTWKKDKFGILVTHVGALLLLLGGFLTAAFSQEGAMSIPPGQTTGYFSDYHKLEFAVTNVSQREHDEVTAFSQGWLEQGKVLKASAFPFEIEILKSCKNCRIEQRELAADTAELQGFARNFDLLSATEAKESEQNQGGVILRIKGAGPDKDGIYAVFEDMAIQQTVDAHGQTYLMEIRRARTYLPFKLQLIQFEKKLYAGTGMAKSYKSEVNLLDGGISQRAVIQMNEPLRHKGYTFYQSSFIENPSGDTTILTVVKNAGRTFPYISSIIMCIGLLIHLIIQSPKLLRARQAAGAASVVGFVLLSLVVQGAVALSARPAWADRAEFKYSELGQVPILNDGRIKPLDTFARVHLLAFNGKSKASGQTAIEWLIELLFDSSKAYERKIFNIADPAVVEAMGLKWGPQHRYSFVEVTQGLRSNSDSFQQLLNKKEEERSGTQNHMVELYEKYLRYLEISRSLSTFLPEFYIRSERVAKKLGFQSGERFSFREIINRPQFEETLKKAMAEKQPQWSDPESRELSDFAVRLDHARQDVRAEIFRIIPPQWEQSHDLWLAPTALMGSGLGSPESTQYLDAWKQLYQAYQGGDSARWKEASLRISNESMRQSERLVQPWKIKLEYIYNRLDLFTMSLAFYLLAFVALALSWIVWPKVLPRVAAWMLGVGAIAHLVGMIMRIVIMGRPPVATLYESIIFVGLVAVLFGLYFEKKRKDGLGVLIGSLMGVVLQFMSTRYETSGDTMGMLVAVLNTNFWLATHVVTITIGYGCCFVGGLMGHIYLLLRVFKPNESIKTEELNRNMVGVGLVALFFSLFGTILGGIWADQSWGRFWGWDPKENGALLICLWLLFLLHAKLCGLVGRIGFAAGMIITNIIVALAWFGVNLLNVGLHTYGFTQNIAINLAVFCGAELLFSVIFFALARQRESLQTTS